MTDANQTFRGEFELTGDTLQDQRLADFNHLPDIEFIWNVASDFKEAIEFMPYQKDGSAMSLLVSAYLKPIDYEGRVIVVLIRGEFPSNRQKLADLVASARERLASLEDLSERFDVRSIDDVKDHLSQIQQKIASSLS